MFRLSGFGDEISANLTEQMDVLESEGIKFIDFRGVNNKGVLDLTDQEAKVIREQLISRGFGISAIASPIGKISITDDFSRHLERFKRAMYLAQFFGTPYIRIFSYYIPKGEPPENYRSEVIRRMAEKVKLAEKEKIILLHENESGIYGNTHVRCLDILDSINGTAGPRGSAHLAAVFDPANFVVEGERPYTDCFGRLKKYVVYLHIKDARMIPTKTGASVKDTPVIMPAGEGDGQIKEILAELKTAQFDGFVSLEPHLSFAGSASGFTGSDLFKKAIRSLKGILAGLEE